MSVVYQAVKVSRGLPGPYLALLKLLALPVPVCARSASESWRPTLMVEDRCVRPHFSRGVPPSLEAVLVGDCERREFEPCGSSRHLHLLLLWRAIWSAPRDALAAPGPLVWSWRGVGSHGARRDARCRSVLRKGGRRGQTSSEVMIAFLGFVALIFMGVNLLSLTRGRLDAELGRELAVGGIYNGLDTQVSDRVFVASGLDASLSNRGGCEAWRSELGIPPLDRAILELEVAVHAGAPQVPIWSGGLGHLDFEESMCQAGGFLHEDEIEIRLLESWSEILEDADKDLQALF